MLVLDARLTLLAILSGIATQSLAPTATAYAAVISRTPQDQGRPFHETVGGDGDPGPHAQHVLPWPAKARNGTHRHHQDDEHAPMNRTSHKVRTIGFAPSNPFVRIADAAYSRIKRSRGHAKRSHKSIIIPNDHGTAYVIPKPHSRRAATPQWISTPQSSPSGTPGSVGIMSHVDNSTEGKLIASLFLTDMNGTYVLNASDTNKTQLYLINSSTSRDAVASNSSDNMPVKLAIPFSNTKQYCATYDPNPPRAEPLTMEPCFDEANATAHKSQLFMHNQNSGIIRPTWFTGQDDGKADEASVPSTSQNTTTTVSANGTETATSSQATSTTLSSRDDSNSTPSAQNVTLVFIPTTRPAAAAADVDESSGDAQNSTSTVATTTMTQTVTVFGIGSASVSSTASATDSASSTNPSAAGLNVEVVGDISSSSSGSSTSSASVTTSLASSATYSSAATSASSVDAAAIASSIASSYSASFASASASASSASASASSASAVAADVSASASASASSTSTPTSSSTSGSATYVAAVMERDGPASPDMTPVSTDPYLWRFKAESR